jgi:hypothetical protein
LARIGALNASSSAFSHSAPFRLERVAPDRREDARRLFVNEPTPFGRVGFALAAGRGQGAPYSRHRDLFP